MDTTPTPPHVKQKNGIKKLWARWKASRKSRSETMGNQTSTSIAKTGATEDNVNPAPAPVAAQESTPVPETTAISNDVAQAPLPTTVPVESAKEMPTSIQIIIEVDESDCEETSEIPVQFVSVGVGSTDARFDRAQAIFQKYNMTLNPADWYSPPKSDIQRVEKKPRMRVRYTCQQCKAVAGRDKICIQCSGPCLRYPPKKTGNKQTKVPKKTEEVAAPILAEVPTQGQCHDCKETFVIGDAQCENCNHKICETCLTDTVVASPATAPPPASTAAAPPVLAAAAS